MSRHESLNRRLDRVEARLKAQRSLPASLPVPLSHPSPRPQSLRDYDRFASETVYEEEVRRSAALPEGPFADPYLYNPYRLAKTMKYALATLKASGRLSGVRLTALAVVAGLIIDHVFAAEFGEEAFKNPNGAHFPDFGI